MKKEYEDFLNTFSSLSAQHTVQFKNSYVMYYGGGKFTLTYGFLAYLDKAKDDEILIDDNYLPVEISNMEDFRNEANDTFKKAVAEHHKRYQKLVQNDRTIGSLFDD